jgi:hypothetical protein
MPRASTNSQPKEFSKSEKGLRFDRDFSGAFFRSENLLRAKVGKQIFPGPLPVEGIFSDRPAVLYQGALNLIVVSIARGH